VDASGEEYDIIKWLDEKVKTSIKRGSGKRSIVKTDAHSGRYVKSRPLSGKINDSDLAFDATLRAAAPYQRIRDKNGMAIALRERDIRVKVREKRTGNFILFVVDASGSMGAGKRMTAVKGAILSLLNDAYQKRDKVGLIMFKHRSAELVLSMTRSVDIAKARLDELPTGGKTSLCMGLDKALETIKNVTKKDKDTLPVVVLVSDGRATSGYTNKPFDDAMNAAYALKNADVRSVVIDAEQDFITLGLAMKIAQAMDATYFKLEELRAENIVSAVSIAVND